MVVRHRVARNVSLLSLISFLGNFRLNAPILIIYLQQQTGSLTTAMSLLAILMVGASLLDIPTGALADTFGRKQCIVLSWICGFVHLVLLALGSNYLVLLVSMLVASLGMALGSGATMALLYESLVELDREDDYKKVTGRVNGLLTLALGIAAPIGAWLASIALSLPFWLQLVPQCLGLCATVSLQEPLCRRPVQNNLLLHSLQVAKAIVGNRQLLLLLLMTAVYFASGETLAVVAPKWYQMYVPLIYVGLAFTASYMLSSLGFFLASALSRCLGDVPLLLASTLYTIVVPMIATFLVGPFSVMLAVSASFCYGVRYPILDVLTNRQIVSSQRATIGSYAGVLQRFLCAVFTLCLGFLSDRLDLLQAIRCCVLALVLSAICVLLLKNPCDHSR